VQLTAKTLNFCLLTELQQGPQPQFNRLALGLEAGRQPEPEAANRK
jgi:hypothetical protein